MSVALVKKKQKEKEKPYQQQQQQQQQTNIQKYYLLNYILFPLSFSFLFYSLSVFLTFHFSRF